MALSAGMSTMIRRHVTDHLLAALSDSPVVLLNGARQTGKSTLVQDLVKGGYPARYYTLDDPSVLSTLNHDPAAFLAAQRGPVVLDEVQRAPGLFMALKAEVDRDRRPGRYLLTGSANVLLLPALAEFLVGRMEILSLWPFSRGERVGVRETFIDAVFASALPGYPPAAGDEEPLFESVLRGGYPEALRRTTAARRRAWFGSYLTTLLQRDVRSLANIEGLLALPRLLALLATRATGLVNYAEFSRTAALPQSTLKRYLALLETTFLVRHLPAWSGNPGKRLVKAAKLVLCDSGLMAHLLGATAESGPTEVCRGPLLENFAAVELLKQATWSVTEPRLYHFRTAAGQEVDLVLEDAAGRVVGIEVKARSRVGARDFDGLRHLADAAGDRFVRGVVLYTGPQDVPFGRDLIALPVDALWRLGAG